MNASTFSELVGALAPSIQELLDRGYSQRDAESYLQRFQFILRHGGPAIQQDATLDLITRYDASNVQIGMVSFNSMPKRRGNYFVIGKVEADPLILNQYNEVIWEDITQAGFCICKCAQNGAMFLDALYRAACSYSKARRDESELSHARRQSVAIDCSKLAGGPSYLQFYTLMLGCD